MWYVIQVQTGREEQIMEEARSYQVQEYFDEIFAPHYERKNGYSCAGVPLFRRNGYRQSSGRKPLFRNRDTALN